MILARFWPPFWRLKWLGRPLENDINNKSDFKTILEAKRPFTPPGQDLSKGWSAVLARPVRASILADLGQARARLNRLKHARHTASGGRRKAPQARHRRPPLTGRGTGSLGSKYIVFPAITKVFNIFLDYFWTMYTPLSIPCSSLIFIPPESMTEVMTINVYPPKHSMLVPHFHTT